MKFSKKFISAVLFVSMVCLPQALWADGYAESGRKQSEWHHQRGGYQAGDFHNHTAFSDGSTFIQRLTYEAVDTYGLDWFA
jgi:hypothetical protein